MSKRGGRIALGLAFGVLALAAVVAPVLGQAQARNQAYRAPRVADGHPDLNGIWQALNTANYDLEPHVARQAMALRPGPHGPVPAKEVLDLGAVGAVPGGMGVVEGGGFRTSPKHEDEGKPGEVARARPGDQVLPARNTARHLHAVPVPDFSEPSAFVIAYEYATPCATSI